MVQVVPYGKGPVVAKLRRGDPTPAEMQLLAQCVRGGGFVELEHARGEERPRIVQLAFEMQERGLLSPPGEPEVVDRKAARVERTANYVESADLDVEDLKIKVRVWRFSVTSKGRQAYADQMDRYGVKV